MTDDQIHELKFKGTKGALRSLPKGQTTCLISFKMLYCSKQTQRLPSQTVKLAQGVAFADQELDAHMTPDVR